MDVQCAFTPKQVNFATPCLKCFSNSLTNSQGIRYFSRVVSLACLKTLYTTYMVCYFYCYHDVFQFYCNDTIIHNMASNLYFKLEKHVPLTGEDYGYHLDLIYSNYDDIDYNLQLHKCLYKGQTVFKHTQYVYKANTHYITWFTLRFVSTSNAVGIGAYWLQQNNSGNHTLYKYVGNRFVAQRDTSRDIITIDDLKNGQHIDINQDAFIDEVLELYRQRDHMINTYIANHLGGKTKHRKGSYESMTVAELRERCSKRKIVFSGKKKTNLLLCYAAVDIHNLSVPSIARNKK